MAVHSLSLFLWILLIQLDGSQCQICDMYSSEAQCGPGQICEKNRCTKAITCQSRFDYDCSISHGNGISNATDSCLCGPYDPFGDPSNIRLCVSGYCQPENCQFTGQCVHGQTCYTSEKVAKDGVEYQQGYCINLREYTQKEGTNVTLHFIEPGTPGNYSSILWSKKSSAMGLGRKIAYYDKTHSKPIYYGEYCSHPSIQEWCTLSTRITLDTVTGDLTIYHLHHNDEGIYFYDFWPNNTGVRHEIHLNVHPANVKEDSEDNLFPAWVYTLFILGGLLLLVIISIIIIHCVNVNFHKLYKV